jgi:starvation-inducible DNA-binding protein
MLREGSEHHQAALERRHHAKGGAMNVDIGIEEDARKEIAEGLAALLADTSTLYLKTHGYHWNVVGPMFPTLHLMFEQQYVELQSATDVIAERIRALGSLAPGSYAELSRLSSLPDEEGAPGPEEMVRRLVSGNELLVRTARPLVAKAEQAGDVATADLVTGRIHVHEKAAWMLRSTLESSATWHAAENSNP